MSHDLQPQPGECLLYDTEDGRTRVECRFVADTLWLPQSGMAELFQTTKQNVAKHLKAIFAADELAPDPVVNQWLTTAADGKRYRVAHYCLDAILAVGYRVRSPRGTQFRRWATERLREYLVKGFTLDDERLKNPPVAGSAVPDRFDELLAPYPRHPRQRTANVPAGARDLRDGGGLLAHATRDYKILQVHPEQAAFRRDRPTFPRF